MYDVIMFGPQLSGKESRDSIYGIYCLLCNTNSKNQVNDARSRVKISFYENSNFQNFGRRNFKTGFYPTNKKQEFMLKFSHFKNFLQYFTV